jgi:hypothetical protein
MALPPIVVAIGLMLTVSRFYMYYFGQLCALASLASVEVLRLAELTLGGGVRFVEGGFGDDAVRQRRNGNGAECQKDEVL